jgi:hypothetical protein
MDHIIWVGKKLWAGTNREDTWMWHHDNLTLYWSKDAQDYLKKMPCPIEGWPDRTWADRQLHLRGQWSDAVKTKATNGSQRNQAEQLSGNGPEIMSLDCHLFSYVKEATGRNVIATFFLKDGEDGKYSMSNVHKTFEAIENTIRSGSISEKLIQNDFENIFLDRSDGTKSTLARIVEANGCYIPDSANRDRHGRRQTAIAGEKKERQIKIVEQAKTELVDYLERVLEEGGDALNEAPGVVYKFKDEVAAAVDLTGEDGDEEDEDDDEEDENEGESADENEGESAGNAAG